MSDPSTSALPAGEQPRPVKYRVGVDIGGTFTDFVLHEPDAPGLLSIKVPTVPRDPAQGVLDGLRLLDTDYGIRTADIGYFVHGTTIAVNTLIERRGAKLGMLVTAGFRDMLIIQRLRIPNTPAWSGDRPAPLIAREHIYEIGERLRADGSVDRPVALDDVSEAIDKARLAGVTGLVICLLHSYRNPAHEQAVRDHVKSQAPDLYVCCSHEVWPRMREYERAIMAIVNAYVMPPVDSYLGTLEERLAAGGMPAKPYITRSNGGIMTAHSARAIPADTLLSGPAAGCVGAATVAAQAGLLDFVTLDIGGTSADVAIIENGQPQISQSEHIADFPITMPVIGVSSIGAGGGSVAWLDEAGVLKIGPESVGSDPGPACYGRGSNRAAVTDAFVVAGFIDADRFAGGRMPLSPKLAAEAIGKIADGLQLSLADTAEAILTVTSAAIYAELSNLAAARGIALRDYGLVPFGGAGPLLACAVAEEVGVRRILVPPAPGTLCALGALAADVANDFIESIVQPLDAAMEVLPAIHDRLVQRARAWLEREAPALDRHELHVFADMRYVGQSFEIGVSLRAEDIATKNADAIAAAFHDTHERIFAHADATAPVEITDLRLKIAGITKKPPSLSVKRETGAIQAVAQRTRAVAINGMVQQVPVFDREFLQIGQEFTGPTLIDQDDTTVYLAPGWHADVHPSGSLILVQVADKNQPMEEGL